MNNHLYRRVGEPKRIVGRKAVGGYRYEKVDPMTMLVTAEGGILTLQPGPDAQPIRLVVAPGTYALIKVEEEQP